MNTVRPGNIERSNPQASAGWADDNLASALEGQAGEVLP